MKAFDRFHPAGTEGKMNLLVHKAFLDLDITPHRKSVRSGSAARQGPVHLYRAADEVARRHRVADPRGRRFRFQNAKTVRRTGSLRL
jgi:hypothetical protein